MRYVRAKLEEERRQKIWENYVAEGVQAITNNISRISGGVAFKQSYLDLINNEAPKEDTRTGEEIIAHMKDKLEKIGKEGT